MTQARPPKTTTAEEPPDLARQIARVAARLFAERGFEATSVREIVAAADVARPTLYSHFGSKEGLAHAVLLVPIARLVESVAGLLGRPLGPLERLEAVARAYFDFAEEDPDRARFVYALFFGPPGSCLHAAVARSGAELDGLVADAVARAAEAGRVDPARVDACATALRGLIVIRVMDFLYRGRPLGPDLAARIVADLVAGFGHPLEAP